MKRRNINPPPQRKDIPESPISRIFRKFIFQLRKREVKIVKDEIKTKD